MKIKCAVLCAFALVSPICFADGQYGCVTGVAGGFDYENGGWVKTSFTRNNLLVSIRRGGKELEYKEVNHDKGFNLTCVEGMSSPKDGKYLNCNTPYGLNVVFNESSMQGAISSILGAVATDKSGNRDSLFVKTITCQKF